MCGTVSKKRMSRFLDVLKPKSQGKSWAYGKICVGIEEVNQGSHPVDKIDNVEWYRYANVQKHIISNIKKNQESQNKNIK